MKNIENLIRLELKKLLNEGMVPEKTNYMFFSNLKQIHRQCELLLNEFNPEMIDSLLENGHDWASDHISEAKNNVDQVFDFLMNEKKGNEVEGDMNEEGKNPCWKGYKQVGMKTKGDKMVPNCVPLNENIIYEDIYGSVEKTNFIVNELLNEAEYQGRKVTLNRPFLTPDGPKKRSVYVKNKKGNIIKVNFGDPNMKIKKNIPSHRKSFRARHHCETATDKTTPRHWSCKFW